jgi:hypothetical protein
MSEMIERVALAIWRAREQQFPERTRRSEPDGIDHATGAMEIIKSFARAAVLAMREPSGSMLTAGRIEIDPDNFLTIAEAEQTYKAMIDAALKEPTP